MPSGAAAAAGSRNFDKLLRQRLPLVANKLESGVAVMVFMLRHQGLHLASGAVFVARMAPYP